MTRLPVHRFPDRTLPAQLLDAARRSGQKPFLHYFDPAAPTAPPRLVIDSLELCYLREHIDTFVIASGDSDFCPLAYKLRENDRIVIGMAVKESTSQLFVKACDEFIYLRAPLKRREASEPPREKAPPKEKVIPEIAREATAALLSKATAPINPSAIKAAIVRREPDFDERDHGFSSFSRLLEAMETAGLLRREQGAKGQWYVLAPAEAS